MLELALSTRDLARTRFAFSPLWEAVASARVLAEPSRHVLHLPWVRRVRSDLRSAGVDVGLLTDLVTAPARRLPGFLAPTPTTPLPELDAELALLRATAPERVHEELDFARVPATGRVRALRDDPAAGLGVLAGGVEAYWRVAVLPYWPRIRALLEGDVLHRARLLAEGGADRVLDDLAPAVRWTGDGLRIAHRTHYGARSLDGRGLVLVPSVFAWPDVFSKTHPAWQPVLRYPPRGVATLWERGGEAPPGALAAVLGRSRALLLAELDAPASTTELARRTGLTPGGVSQHLAALRAAGMVAGHRTGRHVLYARTSVADGLLAAAGG